MFTNRFISFLLSLVVSINSTTPWGGSIPVEDPAAMTIEPQSMVEEIVDIPIVEEQADVVQKDVIQESKIETPEQSEIVVVDKNSTVISEPALSLSESEIDLIALVTMAEAEGESEEGKRLVIDVILNRYDSPRFPNTISEVIYAKNAFECMWNGRVDRCHVRDDIRQLVIEELQFRTNSNIHYFRTNHYHGFGTPVIQVGNHYFSTY